MMIMPVIFVLTAILAVNNLRTKHDLPSLELKLEGYGKTITIVETKDEGAIIVNRYIDLVKSNDEKNVVKVLGSKIEEYILNIVSFLKFFYLVFTFGRSSI